MSKISERIWILITRILSGEAGPSEKNELKDWLKKDPKHREFYRNIKSSWEQDPEASVETFLFDYESGRNKLRHKLAGKRPVSRKRKMPHRSPVVQTRWLALVVVLLAAGISLFTGLFIWEEPVATVNTYVTSGAEQRIITLHDGSVVRLNRNSKAEIKAHSTSPVREVRLKGEAFFDVAEDPDRPFVIYTDDAVVEVLGTSFNVKEGDEILVAVQEGTVALRHREHEEKSVARLTAGQLGLLSKERRDVKIEETDVENYMGWMNGYLRFDSMPFDQVIRQLERIYGLEHTLDDPSMGSVQLSVYTERMGRDEVFETIALALDFTFQEQNGVIHWQRERQTNE